MNMQHSNIISYHVKSKAQQTGFQNTYMYVKKKPHKQNKDSEYRTTCIKKGIGVIMKFYPYRRCLGMPGEI